MKIHHSHKKGNTCCKNLNKIKNNICVKTQKSFCKFQGLEFIHYESGSNLETTKIHKVTIPAYTISGVPKSFDVVADDVAILASSQKEAENIYDLLSYYFLKHDITLQKITPFLFIKQNAQKIQKDQKTIRVIFVNTEQTHPRTIEFIIKACKTKIVCKQSHLILKCSLSNTYIDTPLVNEIISYLEGDFDTHKRLIAGLTDQEFLVSIGNQMMIRSISDAHKR